MCEEDIKMKIRFRFNSVATVTGGGVIRVFA